MGFSRSTLAALAAAAAMAIAAIAPATAGAGLLPLPQAAPVGIDGSTSGVHPGAIVQTEKGLCTMNFLFKDGAGNRYIATAGHCILGDSPVGGQDAGEQSWAPGTGPVAQDADGNTIGRFVYAILQDPKDFSLIRLDPGVEASAQMPHFGGPLGMDTSLTSSPVVLQFFGNGVAIGNLLPARSALALGTPDPDHVYAQGVIAPGDSGSAIETSDGLAVGVIVTAGVHVGSIGTSGVDAGDVGITRLPPQVARAEQVLGVTLTLQTAPLL